jgi:hypothetical protein
MFQVVYKPMHAMILIMKPKLLMKVIHYSYRFKGKSIQHMPFLVIDLPFPLNPYPLLNKYIFYIVLLLILYLEYMLYIIKH